MAEVREGSMREIETFVFGAFEFQVTTDYAGRLIAAEVSVMKGDGESQMLSRRALARFAAWLENVNATTWLPDEDGGDDGGGGVMAVRVTLKTGLDSVAWSTRVSGAFKDEKLVTVGDLVEYDKAMLRRVPNLGAVSVKEIEETLAEHGFKLGQVVRQKKPPKIGALDFVKAQQREDGQLIAGLRERVGKLEAKGELAIADLTRRVYRLVDNDKERGHEADGLRARMGKLEGVSGPAVAKVAADVDGMLKRISEGGSRLNMLEERMRQRDIDGSWVDAMRLRLNGVEIRMEMLSDQIDKLVAALVAFRKKGRVRR